MRVKEVNLKDYEINTGFAIQKRIVSFLPIYETEMVFEKEVDANDYLIMKSQLNTNKTLKVYQGKVTWEKKLNREWILKIFNLASQQNEERSQARKQDELAT